ncbi:MAG: hypothetical protein EOP87_03125 [Verrucomicrobiaceae bacterium]|nr:MAG: hypothetical protein EOP87_03125 [Verrucomicrobiaceae bacterium]
MNHSTPPPEDSWESDAVWKLLDDAAPVKAGGSFADDLVRMAKLEPARQPWWKRLFAPMPIAGFAAATAAVALGITFLSSPPRGSASDGGTSIAVVHDPTQDDPYENLQDLAETEALLAAADHLDAFSDQELGNLIGF